MNALTHLLAQEWILSGRTLDPDESAELSEHLAGCAQCGQFAAFHQELLAGVPKVFPAVTHSAGEQRRVTAAVIARLPPRRAASRFFHGTRAVALLFSAVALVALLAFAIVRLIPQQSPVISGRLNGTPTAVQTTPPASSATPAATPSPALNLDAFASILKVYPLVPGAQWVYTDTQYAPSPIDPTQIIHAVFEITETVVEARIVGPDYLARVQTKATPVKVDPAWSSPAPSSDGWSIIHAGKVYGIPADWKYSIPILPTDMQGIDFGTLYLEYQLPLTDGARWCPKSLTKYSLDPAGRTVEPCANDAGARIVSSAAPFQSAAGSFPTCYLLTDVDYITGNALNTFCDGVGIVARKYTSASQVTAGYDWELKSFTAPATAPATPTVTPAPALNLDAFAATLKVFPLMPGAQWIYTDTEYDPALKDPTQIIQAVYEITDTVVEAQISGPSYVVHIQRTVRQVSADPGWSRGPTAAGDQWYTIQPNNQVFGKNANYDGLTLEYQFPLADGVRWCPNSETRGSLDPAAPTVQPCLNNIGARIVSSAAPFQSAAGSFPTCYLLTDVYNTGNILQTFCDGVGVVSRKFDHPGTRFGFSWELKSFTEAPKPTATPAITPDAIQFIEGARWGKGSVTGSEFSPDGKRLGVVTTLGVYIYDAGNMNQLDFIPLPGPAAAFSPDWSLLATGSGSTVTLLRLADKAEVAHLETDQGSVARLMFSPDGRSLASLVQPPGEEVYTQVLDLWGGDGREIIGSLGSRVHAGPCLYTRQQDDLRLEQDANGRGLPLADSIGVTPAGA